MSFKKTKENFICEHCGTENIGNGFTNHCMQCLWSKHVDVDPGDRASACGGMMEPVEVGKANKEWRIMCKCQTCGFERWSPVVKEDDFDEVTRLAEDIAKKKANLLR